MEICLKKTTLKKKSASIVVGSCEKKEFNNLERYEITALSLLLGGYNPLRRYSSNYSPIDLDELKGLQSEFHKLINETIDKMNVSIEDITE